MPSDSSAPPHPLQAEVDDRLERILGNLKTWTPEERSKFCDDAGEHPLWAGAAAQGTAAAAAMERVEYDELDSPLVLAGECKDKGNAAFKAGAKFFGNAVRHYRDALRHAGVAAAAAQGSGAGASGGGGGEDEVADNVRSSKALRQLISTCHANLAAVFLARRKFISVLDECHAALRAWPDNAKAAFRAVKAALALGKATAALEMAEIGSLAGDGDGSGAFAPLVAEARELLALQQRAAAATAAELAAREASLTELRAACRERGIRVGPALFNGMRRTLAAPHVGADGLLRFPVVVLYPAEGQSDYLEEWSEADTLGELLATVLPDAGAPPPWDARGEYRAARCDVFFKSNPCKPIALEAAWTPAAVGEAPEESWKDVRWVRCALDAPLLLALVQESYVVADLPVFYVVPRASAFHAEMLRAAGGAFAELVVPEALRAQMQLAREADE